MRGGSNVRPNWSSRPVDFSVPPKRSFKAAHTAPPSLAAGTDGRMSEGDFRTASAAILGKADYSSRAGHSNGLQMSPRRLCSLVGRRGFCVPSPQEGRETSCINALLLRSFFFLLVVIPANRHSAPTLCRPEREHRTSCLRIEANRRGKDTAPRRAEEWPVAQRIL